MKKLAFLSWTYLASIASALIAFGLLVWPTRSFDTAPFADPSVQESPGPAFSLGFLSARFNLADLPDPPQQTAVTQAPPPPDPAAPLKRYRFLGGAKSGERGAGLFTDGATQQTLKRGETLTGFTLIDFDEKGAKFDKNGLEIMLPLVASSQSSDGAGLAR